MMRKLSLVFLIAILILSSFISGAVSSIDQEAVDNGKDLYGKLGDEKASKLKLPEKEEMNESTENFLHSEDVRTSNDIKNGLSDTPWPKFRGNQKNTGLSPYRTDKIDGAKRWTFSTDGDIKSSPAIGENGTIYFGSSGGALYALNWDGSEKWSYEIGDQIRSSPAIGSDGTIFVGSLDGCLYSISPNGTEKWSFETGDRIQSSPTIGDDGTIYIGSEDGNLYAINPNGGEKWKFRTDRKIVSSPAIGEDGTIYFGSRDQNIYAVYPNGTKRWSYDADGEIDSSPAIGSKGKIYFGTYAGSLYAFNSEGNKSWKFETEDQIRASPAIGEDGKIYIGSNDNNIYALDSNGTEKWSFETGDQIRSSPVIGSEGTIYVGSWDHNLYAIYPNGTEKWSLQIGDRIRSSPAVGKDRTIYLGSNDDNLYAVTETKELSIDSTEGGNVIKPSETNFKIGYGEKVYLEANAFENWTFVEWIGDNETIKDKKSNQTMIKILGNYSIKAKFHLINHNLTLDSSEGGKVIEPGENNFEYEHGKTVEIVAESDENYTFQGWAGDNETIKDDGSKATTIEMFNDYEVKAVFVRSAFFKLEMSSIEEDEEYVEGELITINYTVKNVGALNDSQTIEFSIDEEVIKSNEGLKLEGGEIANYTFTWYAEKPYGKRTISLKSQNDTDEVAIQILERSYFEVEMTSPKEDNEFTEGDTVKIDYLVENIGDLEDTQTIELLVDEQPINKKEKVTLGEGEIKNYSFSWEAETPSNEKIISVRSNDSVDNVTIEILEEAHFMIDKFSFDDNYVDGNTVKIEYIVKNIGGGKRYQGG
ncbi:MAG: PQQ-binding-like beta-propeller repeat protein [Thermoplasmatota archaeon]